MNWKFWQRKIVKVDQKLMEPSRPAPKVPAPKSEMKVSESAAADMRIRSKTRKALIETFKAYEPAKGVLPSGVSGHKLAMDSGFSPANAAANYGLIGNINAAFDEGYAWPGFIILAQWAQVPEFRRPAEVYAREMTRKWIKLQATGDEDKTEKLKQIESEFKRLNVQKVFRTAIEQDGFFGRSQIFIDVGIETDNNQDELKTDLIVSKEKIGKGALKRLTVVEPMWSYPNRYNANDPLDVTYYKPTSWFVMGKEIHSSRLLTIITRQVPDILKPAYAFSGLSLLQMMKPYVDNWLRTRQSVSDLIHSFTVWTLKTNLSSILQGGAAQGLLARAQMFNNSRDNHGLNIVDKDTEDFMNVSASLGSLDKLQAQSQEQMAAPTGLPLIYLTGITPAGLNASSQDEIEVFQDTCAANQEIYTPALSTILNIVQLSLFGEIDPEIGFMWEPLKVVSETEKANIRKTDAETDGLHVEMGVVSPQEVRKRVANEEDSPYSGIDVNEEITPPSEEDLSDEPEMKHLSGSLE